MKIKHGRVKNLEHSDHSVIVEGLAQSIEGARTILKKKCELPFGRIISTFGTKGNVEVERSASDSSEIQLVKK